VLHAHRLVLSGLAGAAALGAAAALSVPAARAADLPVDVELVLAVDISGSVDEEEARLQRDGYIDAITNPRVVGAVSNGVVGRIAVTYLEWSGDLQQTVVVPWTLIEDQASADLFASRLSEAPLSSGRWTSISGAIDAAVVAFEDNGFEGMRRVIDISGDGYNNSGRPVTIARDEAVERGIVINGLPILNDRPNPWGGRPPADLDRYYDENVIGGPGAFSVPALDFGDFGRAILAKLIREIADLDRTPDLRHAGLEAAAPVP